VPTRLFTVVLKSGEQMPRADLEAAIAAHNEATGEHFEVVWDFGAPAAAAEAKAIPFVLPTLDGEDYDFGAVLGSKPAVVSFWASWCAPCVVEAPHLQAMHEELGDQVAIVGVSIDEPAKHGKLRSLARRLKLGYPIPLDADGSVYATFNPGGSIPYTIVVDATGEVTYVATNFEEGDEVTLRRAVHEVLEAR